jgi:thiamine-phosphate pyrophosphorylase
MATASSSPGPSPAARAPHPVWSPDSRLYLITAARPDLEDFLEAAVRGGVDLVQLREKGLPDGQLLPVLEEARTITARLGVPLVVNDRPDLAVLVGADFVHVGQGDLPVEAVRRFGLPVGLSTHSPAELRRAEADYVGIGPVFATPTKEGRPAVGLGYVRHAAEHARVPWFAIGGIDEANVGDVVAAGARRIAVVRSIGDADDPEQAARALRAAVG